jgi:hypothetical protein
MSIHRVGSGRRRILTATAVGSLAVGLVVAAAPVVPVDAAAPTDCRVRNVSKGEGYRSLAAAVREAGNGNKLEVRGTCKGQTTVRDKRLTIVGVRTTTARVPKLLSNGTARVLTVKGRNANVTLTKLVVKGNPKKLLSFEGGGIRVERGKVILRDSSVRGFSVGARGGGMSLFFGSVVLRGSSTIQGNAARGDGGGIHSEGDGSIRLEDSSAIKSNVTRIDGGGIRTEGADIVLLDNSSITGNLVAGDSDGGGIYADFEHITMLGSSTIAGNEARYGGGIRTQGRLEMSATASITANTARLDNGGIDGGPGYEPVGVVCAPEVGANVFGNAPDDCGT